MSVATLPKGAGFLRKLAQFNCTREQARRAQRRLDQALHTRGITTRELERMQEGVESLWSQCDRAGSELARAKNETATRMGVA